MGLGHDLGLVSTEALVEELKGRHDAGLVVLLQVRGQDRDDVALHEFWGGAATCIGICTLTREMVLRSELEGYGPSDEDPFED